ncbi:putative lactoylglutathione lyase [Rosa chinensis]|uniref:Putative lactoylglutathione lyase n=1 Tax=Rosa chinensis TaxID=74649 RepID=A0A2P6QCJ7_ROSCH|nr:putative lactoylglutathione lyase [Rosa chinensis]
MKMVKNQQLVYSCILLFICLIDLSNAARSNPPDDVLEWVQKDDRRFLRANIRIYTMVEKIRAAGGVITREPGPVAPGGTTIYAFVNDPDGYSFELFRRPPTPEPLNHICLNVVDIDRSIDFYQKALGMNLLVPKYNNAQEQYTVAMVGYGSNYTQTTVIELQYNYNVTDYTKGNGYAQVAIGTDDVYKSAAVVEQVIQELGGKIIQPPGPIPFIKTKITAFLDSDGFETVLVDNQDYLKYLKEE